MTSGPHLNGKPAAHRQLRLRLKPKAPATGYVDGAWWPRSRDLPTELAELSAGLAVLLGRIERVAYALSTWDTAPRRLAGDGFRVRLEGFTYQDRNIVYLTGSNRDRISLLVVPPEMTGPAGQDAMMTAARRGNDYRPEEILTAAAVPAPRRGQTAKQDRDTR